MRISVWCPYYPPHTGGLETYAEDLHRELGQRGHQITVFTPDLPARQTSPPNPNVSVIRYPAFDLVYNFPFPKVWYPAWWSKLRQFYSTDADIVISYTRFFLSSLFALLHSRAKKIAWLHVEHGSDFVTSDRPLVYFFSRLVDFTWGRYVFRLSSINVAPSQSAQKFISRFDTRPVPLIYRGLNYDAIDVIAPSSSLKSKYPGQIIIVYAGRLINGKNVASLIRSMTHLKNSKAILLIAGTGDEKDNLHSLTKNLGLSPRITFLGNLSWIDTIALIKISDIVVNPSFNEGLPTLVLEASACGRAVIASNAGGTPEIITAGHSGILFDPAIHGQLLNALNQCISDPAFSHKLGINARQKVVRQFNWSTAAASYCQLLSSLS